MIIDSYKFNHWYLSSPYKSSQWHLNYTVNNFQPISLDSCIRYDDHQFMAEKRVGRIYSTWWGCAGYRSECPRVIQEG